MTMTIVRTVGCLAALGVGIAVLVSPDGGLIYHNPVAPLAVGLIGLGLIKQARRASHGPAQEHAKVHGRQ